MTLASEFRTMVTRLGARFSLPPIASVFFPPFRAGGQPTDAQFMAVSLEGGATGISFVLLPDEKRHEYAALQAADFVGQSPQEPALAFGGGDPLGQMTGLASINAICQYVMRETGHVVDTATDSLGLLSISAGDRVGMVGLFFGLIKVIERAGAELLIVEENDALIRKHPDLPVTRDVTRLSTCNKVLSTSTTVLNNSLDEILAHCSAHTLVSVVGPTAGYFPDPLFARGVDVVGGRVVQDGALFLQLLAERRPWGDATQRVCFQKDTYAGML